MRDYIEKPTYHYTVSTGIYVFEPLVLSSILKSQPLDLPDLIRKLLGTGEIVATYPCTGLWLDIGRLDDYEHAVAEFEAHRQQFIPED